MEKTYFKRVASVVLVFSLLISFQLTSVVAFAESAKVNAVNQSYASQATASNSVSLSKEYSKFLKDNYNITFADKVTGKAFTDAIVKSLKYTEPIKLGQQFLCFDAVSITVKAAGLKELAYTYPEQKIVKSLNKIGLKYDTKKLNKQLAQEIAVAIEVGLVPQELYSSIKVDAPVTANVASTLIGKSLSFIGKYKKYLGYISDADIYIKINNAWNAFSLVDSQELSTVVDQILKQDIITGYNIKDVRTLPNFDPALSLVYGHSDITHAIQLIGLLKSEGIDAKVQFEPKTSAFIYLQEWGKPTITPEYKVVQIENGNYIAYTKEYDIEFEFASKEQKDKFQDIIFKYAKKDTQDQKGLLFSSWWQPLYYSTVAMNQYDEITNNRIIEGDYLAQTFTFNKDSEKVINEIKKIDPKAMVESYKLWVDKPFYNYLLGLYK